MYKIKNQKAIELFINLNEAFTRYKELRSCYWWDFIEIKILSDDDQDITQIINDYLDGVEHE